MGWANNIRRDWGNGKDLLVAGMDILVRVLEFAFYAHSKSHITG